MPQAYYQEASCLIKLKEYEKAIESFRKSFDAQRTFPSSQTQAYLHFSTFIIDQGFIDLYLEANKILNEFVNELLLFPKDMYEYCISKSIFYLEAGELEKSKEFGAKAIESIKKTDSGFNYHKDIGLAANITPKSIDHLRNILGVEVSN